MEWISVKDRLPEETVEVIVSIQGKYKFVDFSEYNASTKTFDEPYYGQDIGGTHDDVTHWMSLPEPPE